MFVSIELPVKETPYYRMEDYPYMETTHAQTDLNDHAIRTFLRQMCLETKVVTSTGTDINNLDIKVARLAEHEVRRRFGSRVEPGAAYYDVSGVPVRLFYRGSTDGTYIDTPLKTFARRGATQAAPARLVEKREQQWEKWEQAQSPPIFGYPGRVLPTHGVFPRCVDLKTSPPTPAGGGKANPLIEKWFRSGDFTIETEHVVGEVVKQRWTQERIFINPKNPLFSLAYDPTKIQIKADDREDGSPSSPLVTLRRSDAHNSRGHRVGHPAFFFIRIEKFGDKYMPWRGPPAPPLPPRMFSHYSPPSSPGPAFSLRKRLIYH